MPEVFWQHEAAICLSTYHLSFSLCNLLLRLHLYFIANWRFFFYILNKIWLLQDGNDCFTWSALLSLQTMESYNLAILVTTGVYSWPSKQDYLLLQVLLQFYLIVNQRNPEGRQFSLFVIQCLNFGGHSFSIRRNILILSILFFQAVLFFLSFFSSCFITNADVLSWLQILFEDRTIWIPFQTGTIHFIFAVWRNKHWNSGAH